MWPQNGTNLAWLIISINWSDSMYLDLFEESNPPSKKKLWSSLTILKGSVRVSGWLTGGAYNSSSQGCGFESHFGCRDYLNNIIFKKKKKKECHRIVIIQATKDEAHQDGSRVMFTETWFLIKFLKNKSRNYVIIPCVSLVAHYS